MKRSGMNMEAVKKQNRIAVLKLIDRHNPISRKDIANQLGLTPAAVTLICTELLESGLLYEVGTVKNEAKAGRKKVLLAFNYDYKYVFGIELEPKKTYLVLSNLCGKIIERQELETQSELEPVKFIEKLAKICKTMQQAAQIPEDKILGAGICTTGIVDKEKGIAVKAYGIWEEPVPICDYLQKELQIPVYLENNVNAYAKAELLWGAGRERENLLLIKWGPGVGSAVVLDGEVYEGHHGKAAELGHFIVKKDGEQCKCGRRGCLETMVSITALQKRIPRLNAENMSELLENGTDSEKQILTEAIDLFAQTIVNSTTILAPDRVVLFGDLFVGERVREQFLKACGYYEKQLGKERIVYSKIAGLEKYIGAVAFFILRYIE